MINTVYINCYSCVKCAIGSVCMTCRRSVTDGEIRSSSHIYTSLSHRLSSERKSVLLDQISPPSVLFHPNTHMGDWLRDLQNVSWVKATSFVFSSTHTPDVDLGSDQTCCRVPGVTSLAKTFLSNLTDPLTSHGNDAKKEQWREKRDGRG